MTPFIVLVVSFLLFRALGALAIPSFRSWVTSLRWALAGMFLLTASAHFGDRRPDLVRMVPPSLPEPDLLVTLTGVAEILGAGGSSSRAWLRGRQAGSRSSSWQCSPRTCTPPGRGSPSEMWR